MSFLHGYPITELVLVLFILQSGVMANLLNSPEPFSLRKLSGNMIHGMIVALMVVAWDLAQHASIHHTVAHAGLLAVAWPHTIKTLMQFNNSQK